MARPDQWEDQYPDGGYEEPVDISEATPRILLMGSRRSGKSSLAGVVFQKMPPHETMFMDSTAGLDIKHVANNAFVQFQVWDFPGDFDFTRDELVYGGQVVSPQVAFAGASALVYVVDAQDEPYQDSLSRLAKTIQLAHEINPSLAFEVFVHKVDGDLFLTDEQKIDCQHEVQQTVLEELAEANLEFLHFSFYLTSIYDHTVFEAFSRVVQKLMPEQQYSTLENLLNDLISNSNMEKTFLFDVVSKIYIATDSNPVDMHSYELCSDMIDVVIDVSCIYGLPGQRRTVAAEKGNAATSTAAAAAGGVKALESSSESSQATEGGGTAAAAPSSNEANAETSANGDGGASEAAAAAASGSNGGGSVSGDSQEGSSAQGSGERSDISGAMPSSQDGGGGAAESGKDSATAATSAENGGGGGVGEGGSVPVGSDKQNEPGDGAAPGEDGVASEGQQQPAATGWAYDHKSSSVMKLSNGMVLYLREVSGYLALVCLLRADNLTKRGLIDYNIDCFKGALAQVFQP